ncbi:hypothetical protein MYX77_12520 [Acidobacteriia bacterium AH_259_A11_L15]|nr:hypothetical protein [Acidobacteriia bacterium AH_259_A11_L15]
MRQAGRLPPGQVATLKWPVLHTGTVPEFDARTWDFRVFGLGEQPLRFTYEEFLALPQTADVAGLWERNGYHLYGDPWKEQRFDTD